MATVFIFLRAALDTLTGCQSQFGTAVFLLHHLLLRHPGLTGPSRGLPTLPSTDPSLPPSPLSSFPVGPHASCCRYRGTGQRYQSFLASVLPGWVFPWLTSTADHPGLVGRPSTMMSSVLPGQDGQQPTVPTMSASSLSPTRWAGQGTRTSRHTCPDNYDRSSESYKRSVKTFRARHRWFGCIPVFLGPDFNPTCSYNFRPLPYIFLFGPQCPYPRPHDWAGFPSSATHPSPQTRARCHHHAQLLRCLTPRTPRTQVTGRSRKRRRMTKGQTLCHH